MKSPLTRLALALLCAFLIPLAAAEEFTGIIHPERDLTLSLGVGGVVARVAVEPGQTVRAGQPLLSLDDRLHAVEVERRKLVWEDRSEIKATEARLILIRELLETARAIHARTGGVSQDEIKKLEMEVISSDGRLEQLRAQELREELEYKGAEQERQALTLAAPADGVITAVELDVGEWNRPGEPVLRMVQSQVCQLRVSVSRQAARGLAVGMKLPVWAEGRAAALPGRIAYVSPVADAASGLVEIRVRFDNPRGQVRPGASGRVRIAAEAAEKP